MKSFVVTLGLATAFANVANAHSLFTTLLVNDVNQGDGTCVRMPKDGATSTDPIASLDSPDMACGKDGEKAVAFSCPATAGSKMTFEWRLNPDYSAPGSIDISHKGPCAVYLKQVADINSTAAAGPGWFKIWEDGYDEKAGKWCTEKLIDNNGLMSVQLPTGLPGGHYLVRPELLALHNADKGDPQFYAGCAQLFVNGAAGNLNVPAENSVSIPGYVQMGQKSVSFNIWQNPMALPYPIPGPPVYNPTSWNGLSAQAVVAAASSQTYDKGAAGVVPDNCLLKVDNWCGTEVPSYSTSSGCDASAEACNKQLSACYASAGPTGSAGCKTWEAKCQGIQQNCRSGSPNGPPNAGVKLQSADQALPGPIPDVSSVVSGVVASVASGTASNGDASQVSQKSSGAKATSSSVAPAQPSKAVKQAAADVASSPPTATTMVAVVKSTPSAAASTAATGSSGNKISKQDDTDAQDDNTTKPTGDLKVSTTGKCGASSGMTCKGSVFGQCCSKSGHCGSSRFHCGAGSSSTRGCQADYGVCKGNDGGAVTASQNGATAATTDSKENQGTGSNFQQNPVGKMLGQVMDALHV